MLRLRIINWRSGREFIYQGFAVPDRRRILIKLNMGRLLFDKAAFDFVVIQPWLCHWIKGFSYTKFRRSKGAQVAVALILKKYRIEPLTFLPRRFAAQNPAPTREIQGSIKIQDSIIEVHLRNVWR